MSRRVVMTGLGAVTGLGVGMPALWEALRAGRSCLRPITRFDASGFRCCFGGEAIGFSAKDSVPKHYRKAVKVMARDIELAVGAARTAVEDAGLVTRGTLAEAATDPTTYAPRRMGCHIGAGLIAAEADELAAAFTTTLDPQKRLDLGGWGRSGMDNLTPLWLLKYLPNMLACHVTIIHGAEGPSNTITCAEASGVLSIGESLRVIERGDADLCFSGGAECKLNLMGMVRMQFAGRLADTAGHTDGASVVRPFEHNPGPGAGGVLGEGGGILVLEEMDAARTRGARAYTEVVGYGAGQSGPPWAAAGDADWGDGGGYRTAVESALDDAGLAPRDIDVIVPMACAVPAMDDVEESALRAVFGDRLADIPLVTLSPAIGNCMAGAGAIAAAVAAACVHRQELPASLHAGTPKKGLDAGPRTARAHPIRHALVATGAPGGQNASLVLRSLS